MSMSCGVLLLLCVTFAHAAKLPPFFSKCKISDPKIDDCILSNIQKGYGDFKKGNSAYHILSLSPLEIPHLFIDVNGGLIINVTDATINGFQDAEFTDVKIDLDKKVISLQLNVPTNLKCVGHYDVNGRILILPIQGSGPFNVTFVAPKITYVINYDIEKQGDKEYAVPKSSKYTHVAERVYFDMQNLFNGDQRLGEQMLKFLNVNWKEVDQEIGTKLGEALGEVLAQLIGNFMKKVPYDELIDN